MCKSRDGFSSLVQRLKVVETCVKTVEPFRALQVEAVFDADFPWHEDHFRNTFLFLDFWHSNCLKHDALFDPVSTVL